MTNKVERNRVGLRRLALGAAVIFALSLQGCASTIGNLALGAGIGAVGTVAALGCAIGCH